MNTPEQDVDAMLSRPGGCFIALCTAYIPLVGVLITGWLA